ncbi:hypothetical protein C8F04DRAFT_1175659 [Mycena alexandri]|uniref:Uncharacterized protein n=1 Tax=Mycena alexandri TaxID=1745969 RepID=A0AAD6TCG4_9AGAR|nr:hypothetical protein C8F04DRAFT_1175659 [Mycena alexandri]
MELCTRVEVPGGRRKPTQRRCFLMWNLEKKGERQSHPLPTEQTPRDNADRQKDVEQPSTCVIPVGSRGKMVARFLRAVLPRNQKAKSAPVPDRATPPRATVADPQASGATARQWPTRKASGATFNMRVSCWKQEQGLCQQLAGHQLSRVPGSGGRLDQAHSEKERCGRALLAGGRERKLVTWALNVEGKNRGKTEKRCPQLTTNAGYRVGVGKPAAVNGIFASTESQRQEGCSRWQDIRRVVYLV